MKAVVAAAFVANLDFRSISIYPVCFSRAAVLEVAVVAGDLEEIAGPCISTVNWCLCLRRALAVQPVSDLRGAGGRACCGLARFVRWRMGPVSCVSAGLMLA